MSSMISEAILLHRHGGAEELRLGSVTVDPPGPGELLVRHSAIDVNFHDIYVRTGLYRTLTLPGIPGLDAVGEVVAAGPGEERFAVGDRIGWISPSYGGYAALRLLPADIAFPLPPQLTDEQAAASIMKAFTVHMLVTQSHRVEAGQSLLIHAAAGGVGQLLCAWCKALGARVIGTVGSEAKAEVARRSGADAVILYREEDVVARLLDFTDGKGVAAVYDSVGRDTFAQSLRCLDYNGTLVNFGQSSGAVDPLTPSDLASRSLKLTRPIIFHQLRDRARLESYARHVNAAFAEGILRPIDPLRFPLAQAAEAHRLLEAGKSPGGIVLIPTS